MIAGVEQIDEGVGVVAASHERRGTIAADFEEVRGDGEDLGVEETAALVRLLSWSPC